MSQHLQDRQSIRPLLENTRTIAVVGYSPKEGRAANFVSQYLKREGYRVIPVNPAYVGQEFLGETCVEQLADIAAPIDIVNIFQRSEKTPPTVDAAIEAQAAAVWMQQGIRHEDAGRRAMDAGLDLVMDRCIMVEHAAIFDREPIH